MVIRDDHTLGHGHDQGFPLCVPADHDHEHYARVDPPDDHGHDHAPMSCLLQKPLSLLVFIIPSLFISCFS